MQFGDANVTFGWGVFRIDPWHYVGVFPTQELAEQEARAKGGDYVARYGFNENDTENFAWKNESVVFACGGSEDVAEKNPSSDAHDLMVDAY